MTYRERRASKRFDCSARLDSSAGLEIFRNWIVNLREPGIWTEGGLLVLSGKRICPIINRCTSKIIQLLIAPVDYQCSEFQCFLWFSAQCFSFQKTDARNARESTQTKIPLLSLCFHSVFMFLFVFQLKELQRVGLTQGQKPSLICTCQSKCEWKRWHTSYCRCWMLWGPHPTFESSKARWVKPFSENRKQ